MVTIKPKPKPDFNYTDVPYSGRDVINPFVDKDSYRKGQDFYPDRMYRDERTAERQFFNSPAFQQSDVGGIFKDFKGMDLKNERDTFINFLNEFQLRQQPRYNFNTKKYDGPMEREGATMDYDPRTYNYLSGLDEARQNQFAKYNPRYGLTDEKYNELIEGQEEPTSWLGYPYGEAEGASVLEEPGRYTLDNLKESTRTLLGDLAFFGDYGTNVVSQALYPFDYEDERGNIYPRGFKDLIQHSLDVAEFEETGYGVSPEVWADLGYSERKDLQDQFKKLTGSNYIYDPTYKPITESGALTELTDTLAEGPLMPSSDYSDLGVDVYDPYFTDDYVNWNPMKSAQLVGHVGTGGSSIAAKKAAKEYLPGLAKYIPSLVKKHPYMASLLGLSIPSIAEPFVE
jgi:hypothetical protein